MVDLKERLDKKKKTSKKAKLTTIELVEKGISCFNFLSIFLYL